MAGTFCLTTCLFRFVPSRDGGDIRTSYHLMEEGGPHTPSKATRIIPSESDALRGALFCNNGINDFTQERFRVSLVCLWLQQSKPTLCSIQYCTLRSLLLTLDHRLPSVTPLHNRPLRQVLPLASDYSHLVVRQHQIQQRLRVG